MFTGSPRAIDIERSPLPYRCRYSGNMKLRALAIADYRAVCVGARRRVQHPSAAATTSTTSRGGRGVTRDRRRAL